MTPQAAPTRGEAPASPAGCSTLAVAAAATVSFFTLGAESAAAHNTGDCQFAKGASGINGHACVVEDPQGNGFTVSSHDAAVGVRRVYIQYYNARLDRTSRVWDGEARHDGPSYYSGRGNITRFAICEESIVGNDRCLRAEPT